LADGEAEPNTERNPEEVTVEKNKVLGAKTETRTRQGLAHDNLKIGQSGFSNRTIQFLQP
jgi:hypothetical protein